MKFTLKEMNGLLNGKCLPSDLIVGETLAEYLVRKFSTLEQRLIESERYGRQTDITIDNLELKLAQMAAENAGLKQFPDQIVGFIGKLGSSEIGSETKEKIEAAAKEIKTPATDAFQAEVRTNAIKSALNDCTECLDRDCIMDLHGISYEDAALREAGAMALHDALLRQERAV